MIISMPGHFWENENLLNIKSSLEQVKLLYLSSSFSQIYWKHYFPDVSCIRIAENLVLFLKNVELLCGSVCICLRSRERMNDNGHAILSVNTFP